MAFVEDPTVFLNAEEHGTAAVFDGATDVVGIFGNEYGESAIAEVPISGSVPTFYTWAAWVPSPEGKALSVNSVGYAIVRSEPDGTGFTTLILEAT